MHTCAILAAITLIIGQFTVFSNDIYQCFVKCYSACLNHPILSRLSMSLCDNAELLEKPIIVHPLSDSQLVFDKVSPFHLTSS